MPCPRQTAVLRLITLWATRSADDDAFAYRVGLGDILQDNVIDIVAVAPVHRSGRPHRTARAV